MVMVIRFSILITLVFLLSACTSRPAVEKNELKMPKGQVQLYGPKEQDYFYRNEKNNYAEYQLGVALSGGGVRSASFAIGALAGLSDQKILPHVDFISTVSGGGYAGYWYMSNLYHYQDMSEQFVLNDLFMHCYPVYFELYKGTSSQRFYEPCIDDEQMSKKIYRFQNHVTQQSDLMNYNMDGGFAGAVSQTGEFLGILGMQALSLIPHNIANTLFDWSYNVSAIETSYIGGLERTFGLSPIDVSASNFADREFKNDDNWLWLKNAKAESLKFSDLAAFTRNSRYGCSIEEALKDSCIRAPIWLINTSVGVANKLYEWMNEPQPLNETVFEISPYRYGSGEYGFVDKSFDYFDVSRAVAVSGAAVDNQFLAGDVFGWTKPVLALGAHLFNLEMGYKIRNYNPERGSEGVHAFLPFPLYYLHGFSRNRTSTDIYLSDGGHTENLGAYSLIVRGIKNILIVDAEQDDKGEFDALNSLVHKLKREEGLTLEINNLPKDEDGKYYLPVQNAHENIFSGSVKGYQHNYVEGNKVNIVYVKSAIILSMLKENCEEVSNETYPCTVYRFYKENNLDSQGCVKQNSNLYPHSSTALTALEMTQAKYFAYRDLARHITNRLKYDGNKLSVVPYYNSPVDVCFESKG